MADDPRFRKSPVGGVPIVKPAIERKSARVHRDHSHSENEHEQSDFEDEEFSETRSPEDLPKLRAGRPTKLRIAHLEKNQDEIKAEVKALSGGLGKVEVAVADMGGQFKVVPQLVETMQGAIDAMQQREHVTYAADAETKKMRTAGDVEAQRAKWQALLKLVAILGAVGTAVATAVAAGRC